MRRLRPSGLLSCIALFLLVCGCNDERPYFLTRDSAAFAIKRQLGSKVELYFTVGRQLSATFADGTRLMEAEDVPGGDHVPFLERDMMNDKKRCVPTAEERLKYKDLPVLSCYYNWLSPQGEAFFKALEQQGLLRRTKQTLGELYTQNAYFVEVGQPVVNVTGIVKSENHATVDFYLTFTHLNEMGRVVFPDPKDTRCVLSHAEFTRYDDGWRLTKLEHPVWEYGPEF